MPNATVASYPWRSSHFGGVAVSLTLALPLARFYTRSLYFDMSCAEREERGQSPQRASSARTPVDPRLKVRLSRQSIRDLRYWRSLRRGEGRYLHRPEPHATLHSDAADVGYGGTLGFDQAAGSPGLWEGRGFWTAEDRVESITLLELRAVRLLLQRDFADYVSQPKVRRVLLHEDNQAVVYVLNAMVSASRPMMAELRRLQALMRALGVSIEARWLPSAVNRYADALSRVWDPGDARATDRLLRSIREGYRLDHVVFLERPVGETLVARKTYLCTQMEEDWGDGHKRLRNPPFDLLPLVVCKIEKEGGKGVLLAPQWKAQA